MKERCVGLIFLLVACACVASSGAQVQQAAAPSNLTESLAALDQRADALVKNKLQSITEKEVSRLHSDVGRWIRNTWLRDQNSPLRLYFEELGVYSYDEMSHVLLKAYWRELNNQPIDLESLISDAQYAEKAVQPPQPRDCPSFPGTLLEMQFEITDIDKMTSRVRVAHVALCPVDGEYWIFEYGRGWSPPTAEQQQAIANYPEP